MHTMALLKPVARPTICSICRRSFWASASSRQPEASTSDSHLSRASYVLAARERRAAIISELEQLASTQIRANTFQPHHPLHRAIQPDAVNLAQLLAANAHVGHHISRTVSTAAYPFIYGTRHDIAIIDVRETLKALHRACDVVRQVVDADGIVVFLGDQGGSGRAAIHNARRLGKNGFGTDEWQPGTITNAAKIFADAPMPPAPVIDALGEGTAQNLTPNDFKPDLLILLSPTTCKAALKEATAANIPTIGIADTNVDPRVFTYPIPANDDSIRCVEMIAGSLGLAGQAGLRVRQGRFC